MGDPVDIEQLIVPVTFDGRRVSLAGSLARDMVLSPLASALGVAGSVPVVASAVLAAWRRQVVCISHLADRPPRWGSPSRLLTMLNCRPRLVRCSRRLHYACNYHGLCPWCYGVRLAGWASRLGLCGPVEDDRTNLKVLVGTYREAVPDRGRLRERLDAAAIIARGWVRRLPDLFGYLMAVEPDVDPAGATAVVARVLVAAPVGAAGRPPLTGGWSFRPPVVNPANAALAAELSAAAAYLPGKLVAPAETAAALMRARDGLRLVSSGGAFRPGAGHRDGGGEEE